MVGRSWGCARLGWEPRFLFVAPFKGERPLARRLLSAERQWDMQWGLVGGRGRKASRALGGTG